MTNQEWTPAFYLEDNGSSPVEDFLADLDRQTRSRIYTAMERLRQVNLRAREPLVRHLERDLWELRQGSDGNIYRFIYFFFSGRRIVYVHAFQKKTQKTPRREFELAH